MAVNNREEYFILLKIALNLLSIFLIFVECERVFLLIKNLIIDGRNRLKEDIIQTYTFYNIGLKKQALNKSVITAGGYFLIIYESINRGFNTILNNLI